jgi:hypothetical protein
MRQILTSAVMLATFAISGAPVGHAQSATERYPYCALDSSTGATSYYFQSRAQCGSRCIANPSYVGDTQPQSYARAHGRFEPR